MPLKGFPEAVDLAEHQNGLWVVASTEIQSHKLQMLSYPMVTTHALSQQSIYDTASFLLENVGPACKGRKSGCNFSLSHLIMHPQNLSVHAPADLSFIFSETLVPRTEYFQRRIQQWYNDVRPETTAFPPLWGTWWSLPVDPDEVSFWQWRFYEGSYQPPLDSATSCHWAGCFLNYSTGSKILGPNNFPTGSA